MVSDAFCYVISLSDLHLYPICCIIEVVCRSSLYSCRYFIRNKCLMFYVFQLLTVSMELRVLEFTKMAHDLHSVIQWRQLGPPSPSSPPPPNPQEGRRKRGRSSVTTFIRQSFMNGTKWNSWMQHRTFHPEVLRDVKQSGWRHSMESVIHVNMRIADPTRHQY